MCIRDRAGYAWSYGPFEYWDMIGIKATAELASSLGEKIPAWIYTMIDKGVSSFYISENGKRKFYDIVTGTYQVIPGTCLLYTSPPDFAFWFYLRVYFLYFFDCLDLLPIWQSYVFAPKDMSQKSQ